MSFRSNKFTPELNTELDILFDSLISILETKLPIYKKRLFDTTRYQENVYVKVAFCIILHKEITPYIIKHKIIGNKGQSWLAIKLKKDRATIIYYFELHNILSSYNTQEYIKVYNDIVEAFKK